MRPKISTLSFLLCLPVFLSGASLVNGESPPTLNDIIAGIKASENRFFQLDSFLVNCERKKSEDITPSRYSGGYINVEFVVARKGDRWFVSKTFTEIGQEDEEGHNMIGHVWVPLEPKLHILKNHLWLQWDQYGESAFVHRFSDWHNAHQCSDYFRHMGWNASRCMMESEGENYDTIRKLEWLGDDLDHPFLPEFLENNKRKYVVYPNQEDVDGFPCWVVEYPGMDKFWIDTEHGYAVRKRVYHWEPGKPKKFAIRNLDWKEVAPGLWLPHKQNVDKYASIVAEDSKIWDKVAARMNYEVNEILINTVPDELFEVSLPVGTRVIDSARETIYTIYDSDHDPFAGPVEPKFEANRYVLFRAVTMVIGSVMIFIALWLMLRRMEMCEREGK
jgi:hypothetical protein